MIGLSARVAVVGVALGRATARRFRVPTIERGARADGVDMRPVLDDDDDDDRGSGKCRRSRSSFAELEVKPFAQ